MRVFTNFTLFCASFLLLAAEPSFAQNAADSRPAIQQNVGDYTLVAIPEVSDDATATLKELTERGEDVLVETTDADLTAAQMRSALSPIAEARVKFVSVKKTVEDLARLGVHVENQIQNARFTYFTMIVNNINHVVAYVMITDGAMRATLGTALSIGFIKGMSLMDLEIHRLADQNGRRWKYNMTRAAHTMGWKINQDWLTEADRLGEFEVNAGVLVLGSLFSYAVLGRYNPNTINRMVGQTTTRIETTGSNYVSLLGARLQTLLYWTVIGGASAGHAVGMPYLADLFHNVEMSLPSMFMAVTLMAHSSVTDYVYKVVEQIEERRASKAEGCKFRFFGAKG